MRNVTLPPERRYTHVDTPIGPLLLVGQPGVLTGVYVAGHGRCPGPAPQWKEDGAALAEAAQQLSEYFEGTRTEFDLDLELDGTPFQVEVWSALQKIPYGETISYRELAEWVGRPAASRAVGGANGRNPASIVVPCHRVIAADGSLGGYGWGTDRKTWLLRHEGAQLA